MGEQRPMIVIKTGVPAQIAVPVIRSMTVLGKKPTCDIVIENPFVSREHARIDLIDGGAVIRDLSSKNGTYVNGIKIGNEPHELLDGAQIEFGQNQVSAEFQLGERTVTLQALPSLGQDLETSNFVVDEKSRQVWVNGAALLPAFTMKEFDVLILLHSKIGQVCTHQEIARSGWPEREGGMVDETEIRQYIRRIRVRFESIEDAEVAITTIRGIGYRMDIS